MYLFSGLCLEKWLVSGKLEKAFYSIHPNPSTSEIKISGIDNNQIWIEISDVNGKVVVTNQLYQESINIESLQNGTYFVTISNANASKAITRFLKM